MEWQYDEHGKKYRQNGPIKEYAPTVMIDGVEVYQDELEDFHRHNAEVRKAQREEEAIRNRQLHTGKTCPLNRHASFPPECKTDCALYRGYRCAFKGTHAAKETEGKHCPFMRVCVKECALYDQGCTL